ncbi:MAG: hypothetical protein QM723_27640 [Myxococcaceae bacterium]
MTEQQGDSCGVHPALPAPGCEGAPQVIRRGVIDPRSDTRVVEVAPNVAPRLEQPGLSFRESFEQLLTERVELVVVAQRNHTVAALRLRPRDGQRTTEIHVLPVNRLPLTVAGARQHDERERVAALFGKGRPHEVKLLLGQEAAPRLVLRRMIRAEAFKVAVKDVAALCELERRPQQDEFLVNRMVRRALPQSNVHVVVFDQRLELVDARCLAEHANQVPRVFHVRVDRHRTTTTRVASSDMGAQNMGQLRGFVLG